MKKMLLLSLWLFAFSPIRISADNFSGIIVHLKSQDLYLWFSEEPTVSYAYYDYFDIILKNGDKYRYDYHALNSIEIIESTETSVSNIFAQNSKNKISFIDNNSSILITGLEKGEYVTIYDINGKALYNIDGTNEITEIPKRKLNNGINILRTNKGYSFKIIIK